MPLSAASNVQPVAMQPLETLALVVKNGHTILKGDWVGKELDTGYAVTYEAQANVLLVGKNWGPSVTGDTSSKSDLYKVRVRCTDLFLEYISVTGVTAVTDQGKPFWSDGSGGYTLTMIPGVMPMGVVTEWQVSTYVDAMVMPYDAMVGWLAMAGIDHTLQGPTKVTLHEPFLRTPNLNATLACATPNAGEIAAALASNLDWEIAGTNAADAGSTFAAGGGVTLTTAGADNDQMILQPHADTSQSAWNAITWDPSTGSLTVFEILTAASIEAILLWAGLKLTNTPTIATDADQVFFRFSTDDTDTEWEIVDSIGGVDTTTASGVTLVAATKYRLGIAIGTDRKARFYVKTGTGNVKLVHTTAALTDDAALKPYLGVQALAAAAKAVTVRHISATIYV